MTTTLFALIVLAVCFVGVAIRTLNSVTANAKHPNLWPSGVLRGPPDHYRYRHTTSWRNSLKDWATSKRRFFKLHSQYLNADQQMVVDMTRHAWKGYRNYAWGEDSLDAIKLRGTTSYNHNMAYTLVDSLDTLFILGLHDEFDEASAWAKANLSAVMSQYGYVSFFETTIRSLGGLLSAYYLSNESHFLDLATQLGIGLTEAFDKETYVPYQFVDLQAGSPTGLDTSNITNKWFDWNSLSKLRGHKPHGIASLAEANSFQLEFAYLAQVSGNESFLTPIQIMNKRMQDMVSRLHPNGLIPNRIDWELGRTNNESKISLGANGDSYYEYLLKQWLQSGKTDDAMKSMYETAVNGMIDRLVRRSKPSGWLYVGEYERGVLEGRMEHLVCFVPGMLALGYMHGMPKSHLTLAEDLARTCVHMYDRTETHLAPEAVRLNTEDQRRLSDLYVTSGDDYNLLRPETVESLMILYRITKDEKYRDYGRTIMKAFEKNCKVAEGGYMSTSNVFLGPPKPKGPVMESFFIGETLKYLFLLFSDDVILPLDEIVFNTEAHPFPIASTTEELLMPNDPLRWIALRGGADGSEAWITAVRSGQFVPFLAKRTATLSPDQARVQHMVRHAWQGYRLYADWQDYFDPINMTGGVVDAHNMAMTLVDSLDTLLIVGLFDEFEEASAWARDNYSQLLDKAGPVSFFETTIRSVAGFLSAYYLSGEQLKDESAHLKARRSVFHFVLFTGHEHLLDLAAALGDRMLKAFDCGLGIPCQRTLEVTGISTLAEANSFQLEFTFLAWATGKDKYLEPVQTVNDFMFDFVYYSHPNGLIPIVLNWDIGRGVPSDVSFGAHGDSYYEYLLKQWLQTGKKDHRMKLQYMLAIESMKERLVSTSLDSNLTYLGHRNVNGEFVWRMEHLTCFVPGMLGLGYIHGMPEWHLDLAKKLLEACVQMYTAMESGLAPEIVYFDLDPEIPSQRMTESMHVLVQDDYNVLRPETIESLFILYRITKEEKYREYGRTIMNAFEAHSKVAQGGYRTVKNVARGPYVTHNSIMESFFISETLKYLFLLFTDDFDLMPLEHMVFNTEAHPLPMWRTWRTTRASKMM
ncbi:TPA: hypothetical protein N0F65_001250 [Lagenidium giganteum]|uniref:alpha-1,2-Mannosidase n=1 Tax=Lagenidium giganteum TaxID=4803 RepID=A0AAV2YS63_9STRA|nr:TPA: hypothetical protein N0F65_001250 [Lagenidium giganteum]